MNVKSKALTRGGMLIRELFVMIVCCLIGLSGCGTKRVVLSDIADGSSLQTVLLKDVEYDEQSMPLFNKTLAKRPENPGERFTIAFYQGGRPSKTFDIEIQRAHGDLIEPAHDVYYWTGKGFMAGVGGGLVLGSIVLVAADAFDYEGDLSRPLGVAIIVPVVIGTVIGFVKGVTEGLSSGWAESQKIALRAQEKVLTYAEYEYNSFGQLSHMTVYDPETKDQLVRTDYYYEEGRNTPATTYIKNFRDNKVRVIEKGISREGAVMTQ